MKRPLEKARPQAPWLLRVLTGATFLILYIPLVTMVVGSFRVAAQPGELPSEWGFGNYLLIGQDAEILHSLGLSLVIALVSTLFATAIGTAGALALERLTFPGKRILSVMTLFPLVMPELVMGLSLLIWFVFCRMTLGPVSIILAHITFCLSYVTVIVRTRLKDFDRSLEEAASDLGATNWYVFWSVTFPLITPGVLAGALVAFTLSFDDFLITFYTAGVGSDTLPLKLYSMIRMGISPELNALSTVLFSFTVFIALVIFKPRKLQPKS